MDGRPRCFMGRVKWSYWRLMGRRGQTIGFMRQRSRAREWIGLTGDRWQAQEIEHADRVRVQTPPKALRFLKGCM